MPPTLSAAFFPPGPLADKRTPPVQQTAVAVVAHPLAVDGGGCITPSRANLDLNDRLIKRGLVVSWHGYRGEVLRVRTGRCLVRVPGSELGKWLSCRAVQVVRP